ncbi:hypothetical protein TWF106_006469 [Orbilia oligospora]|uniref:Uncharacterized protein n=1 Tax=Orbilia oligospora TaxID=2813651 RepID=A0A7C8QQA6_ORBOL|nr:hypothetical protein TWF106_006469 [Orbilia oligospora]
MLLQTEATLISNIILRVTCAQYRTATLRIKQPHDHLDPYLNYQVKWMAEEDNRGALKVTTVNIDQLGRARRVTMAALGNALPISWLEHRARGDMEYIRWTHEEASSSCNRHGDGGAILVGWTAGRCEYQWFYEVRGKWATMHTVTTEIEIDTLTFI